MSEKTGLLSIIKDSMKKIKSLLAESRAITKLEKEYYKEAQAVMKESIETAKAAGDIEYVKKAKRELKKMQEKADINIHF